MVYPALLPLMRTPPLPVVDWTDDTRRFKWTRPFRRKTKSGFCVCAITFQTQSTAHSVLQNFKQFVAKHCNYVLAIEEQLAYEAKNFLTHIFAYHTHTHTPHTHHTHTPHTHTTHTPHTPHTHTTHTHTHTHTNTTYTHTHHTHTHTRARVSSRTHLNTWSARPRRRYLNNTQTKGTNIHALNGIQTRNPATTRPQT
jgi:hypothetical protein